jgi:hypothetical protein
MKIFRSLIFMGQDSLSPQHGKTQASCKCGLALSPVEKFSPQYCLPSKPHLGHHAAMTFDYIIVGAGSAGCVLANRLSENGKHRVLLLEAGGSDRRFYVQMPLGYGKTFYDKSLNWLYAAAPDPGLNRQRDHWPRGKILGGSSSINAMVYIRGHAADYESWRAAGNAGWGWDDVLPAFKKLEDHFLGASEHHGVGGGWRIEAPRLSWAVLDAVGEAAHEMGIRKTPDFNTGDNEGIGYFHVNQKRGRRWSSARGFLKPALSRPNLRLETNVPGHRAKSSFAPAPSDRCRCCIVRASVRRNGCRRLALSPCWIVKVSAATCRIICSSARSTRSRACAP